MQIFLNFFLIYFLIIVVVNTTKSILMTWVEWLFWCLFSSSRGKYLGSDVVGRAAERLGGLVSRDALFAHAEVGNLDVAVLVQQHIVQLQVSINDSSRVQVEQPYCNLCRVEPETAVTTNYIENYNFWRWIRNSAEKVCETFL